MLRAILNKSWRQHPTRHQLYGHLPHITKTIQVRRTRHAGHCWRSRDELIRDVLLWTPTYGRGKAGRPARTYIQQLCKDTECSPENLPEAMNNREKGRERESGISVLAAWHDDDDDDDIIKKCQLGKSDRLHSNQPNVYALIKTFKLVFLADFKNMELQINRCSISFCNNERNYSKRKKKMIVNIIHFFLKVFWRFNLWFVILNSQLKSVR